MKNISFDNPYLLFLLIPLALIVIIPFVIAFKRENRSRGAVTALVCHLAIVTLAVLAVAGMKHTTVMTKTEIYVLADVSNSTSKKTDVIDGYIEELEANLPKNTEMGVITFAADYKQHTRLGEDFVTVRGSGVDDSATDIVSALNYVSTMFSDDTIKRVVLYTDGMSTDPDANSGLIRAIENLGEDDVYVDIVYIDSNLAAGEREIQVSDVEYNVSTYLGHASSVNVLLESTDKAGAIVSLTKNGEVYLSKTASLTPGYNIVNFDLDTSAEGVYDYSVSVYSEADVSTNNNAVNFTQKVNENISVLLVTDNKADVEMVKAIYGENAVIDAYVKPDPPKETMWGPTPKPDPFNVPFTVEDLCQYDEYILSNVAVDEINNADNFIASIDMCVSVFGKSLITAGDNNLRNNDAACVDALNNMLPVNFGNSDSDPKLYTIVIDSSRSMEFKNFDYFRMAKNAGKYLLDFLNEGDYFALVHFSGEVYVPITPTPVTDKSVSEAKAIIDGLTVTQGTMIGRTLEQVCDMMDDYEVFVDKQVMLISDGMSFEGGEVYQDDPVGAATRLKNSGIIVSALNAGNDEGVTMMQSIAAAGGGKYYFAKSSTDLVGVMFDEVADDVTETLITGTSPVTVNRPNDAVVKGIAEIPSVETYVYARAKSSAENILFVDYKKASGTVVKAPLYSYWNYGNGRVSTLTTNLGGDWVPRWESGEGRTFLTNLATTNTPQEKVDYPYTVEVTFDGKQIHIEIIPALVNPDATMTVKVTRPNGEEITERLVFDSYRYFYKFETKDVGKYTIDTTYDWSTKSYTSTSVYNISYSPEYNSFAAYSPARLHAVVRNNGTVTEGGNAVLVTDETRLDTYVVRFTIPFFAAAAALYLVDTIVRKLRWADIVSFFRRRKETMK